MRRDQSSFWDKRAAKYAASPIGDEVAYDHTIARTITYLDPGQRVIEIGCGTGTTALRLAPHSGTYLGTDISAEMIYIARAKAAEAGLDALRFEVGAGAQTLGQTDGADVVLAFNLLHLVEDLEGLLRAVHATLPAGGYFISKTACLADPSLGVKRFAFAAMIPAMQAIGMAPFVRRLSFAGAEAAIAAAGFDIVETGSFPAMSRFIVARRI
ncbi:class I SAM-dependent methyltransferase [Sulfitobacter sp. HNIBRBA3233]|uniref:class I SAM-dependent methyltransferase n=1 Tax=Sulfitobacter marinivivus TaxID=3158558 RepID=UPI0032E01B00